MFADACGAALFGDAAASLFCLDPVTATSHLLATFERR